MSLAILFISVFVCTFLWVELHYYVINRYGNRAAFVLSLVGLLLGFLYSYFSSSSTYARETKQIALISFSVIVFVVPIIVCHFLTWLTRKNSPNTRHVISALLAFVNCFLWPFFALVTGCYVQLDCI